MLNSKSKIYALRLFCITLVFSLTLSSSGQTASSFGLGFYNNETVQDRRTGLDLTPDAAFAFHSATVDLSFDFSFVPGHNNFFGYIFRLIRNNTQNIDLLFDKVNLEIGH